MVWTEALWDEHILWISSRREVRRKRLETIVPRQMGYPQFSHLVDDTDWYSDSSVYEMDWQPDPMDLDEPEVMRPPEPVKPPKDVEQPQKPLVKKEPKSPEVKKEREKEKPVTAFTIQW